MKPFDFLVRTKQDLIDAVAEFGFVPLFANAIPGFSVEEHAVPQVWYNSGDGNWPVWDWKGPVIREAGCFYGKFFDKKATFVRADLFCDFANVRRRGYDYDALCDEGLAPYRDRELYELLSVNAPVRSRTLKRLGGYGKDGKKGFDTIVTRLQAQCYVTIADFVYDTDRHGAPYGWGIAEYTTPEIQGGEAFISRVYQHTQEQSLEILLDHFRGILPNVPEAKLKKLITA